MVIFGGYGGSYEDGLYLLPFPLSQMVVVYYLSIVLALNVSLQFAS